MAKKDDEPKERLRRRLERIRTKQKEKRTPDGFEPSPPVPKIRFKVSPYTIKIQINFLSYSAKQNWLLFTYGSFLGILHGVHWGLGHGSGELIGGFLISTVGASTTFSIFGTFCLVLMGAYVLVNNLTNGSDQEEGAKDKMDDIETKGA